MAVIGIDLGGTKLAGAIFDGRGRIIRRAVVELQGRRGGDVAKLIEKQVASLLKTALARRINIEAIGVCIPGIAHEKTGRVWAPNIPGWEDYPLRDAIISALGPRVIRVCVDSDRAACIRGEVWQGAARGCHDAIFLAVGTGIGAGILADGKILRGAQDIAGAIGWLALSRPFHPAWSGCGDFESHASGAGLARVARHLIAQMSEYRGPLRRNRELTARDVFAAYDANDPVATYVLGSAIEYWGMAAANLVSLFNPEKIIFGGGVFGPATCFLNEIRAEAKKWAQPISMRRVRFVPSQLGGDAGLYGAGFLALRALGRSR